MGATPTPRPYWTPDAPVVRLSEPERTSIAEQIRTLVEGFSLTYTWLIRQLSDEGLMTDKFEMSATLAGVRTGSKADEILRRSLSILREYQERMGPCKAKAYMQMFAMSFNKKFQGKGGGVNGR